MGPWMEGIYKLARNAHCLQLWHPAVTKRRDDIVSAHPTLESSAQAILVKTGVHPHFSISCNRELQRRVLSSLRSTQGEDLPDTLCCQQRVFYRARRRTLSPEKRAQAQDGNPGEYARHSFRWEA